jgi:transcriptional regulator with XRE-family HTH domain
MADEKLIGVHDMAASIRAARKAKALTQSDLGHRVGLPQSHISKIEKGAVDLQLSSLVQIARALDHEVKLVPRKALPVVEGALRAHGVTVETSRALAALAEQAQLAQRIEAGFPGLPEVDAFRDALRDIPRFEYDAAQLKALEVALKPARQLKALLEGDGGSAALAKRVSEATAALRHFRNQQVHSSLAETSRQVPAYRLDEDGE